jgi:alpha-beta hydrolase superfamily lysophospholipase
MPPPINGYPLIFMLHHSGANTRAEYNHFAQIGLDCGYAVFRWDKRGTGRSGAGGRGSTTQDAIMAYKTAVEIPDIDPDQVVIMAQCASTVLLGEAFDGFAEIQHPHGVILMSNMLEPDVIPVIDTQLHIIMGELDWNEWRTYARAACDSHNKACSHGASYYIARGADRMLMVKHDDARMFHDGLSHAICDWLHSL